MEIIIGATPRIATATSRPGENRAGYVEARILNSRSSRKRYGNLPVGRKERRGKRQMPDPSNARVITLLIPEGKNIPEDLDAGQYRVFLRFVPKRGI